MSPPRGHHGPNQLLPNRRICPWGKTLPAEQITSHGLLEDVDEVESFNLIIKGKAGLGLMLNLSLKIKCRNDQDRWENTVFTYA